MTSETSLPRAKRGRSSTQQQPPTTNTKECSMNLNFQPVARNTLTKTLDLAIRGLPRKLQPVPTLVDTEAARELLLPELIKLEALGPDHNHFSSSLLAAAVLSLHSAPECAPFWACYIDEDWIHDGRGYDSVGVLTALVEDCKIKESISRSTGAQYLLFRSALTVALRAAENPDTWRQYRFDLAPSDCDVCEVLERVRINLNQTYTPEGFIHPDLLRAQLHDISPPEFGYKLDLDLALEMAKADPGSDPLPEYKLLNAKAWLGRQSIPARLRNPALMAAAIRTVAEDEGNAQVWENLFASRWYRYQSSGLDVAGRLYQSVQAYHTGKQTLAAATMLYRRSQSALDAQERQSAFPTGWKNLPKGRKDPELARHWAPLGVVLEPTIAWNGRRAAHPACPTKPHKASQIREFTTIHETGGRAEDYFARHYRNLLDDPTARLIDHRNKGRGYDFLIIRQIDGEEVVEYYEIKGCLQTATSVRMTDRQWKRACQERESYKLVLIENLADGKPTVRIIENPAECLRPERQVENKPVVSWHVDACQIEGEGHCISNAPLETGNEG